MNPDRAACPSHEQVTTHYIRVDEHVDPFDCAQDKPYADSTELNNSRELAL